MFELFKCVSFHGNLFSCSYLKWDNISESYANGNSIRILSCFAVTPSVTSSPLLRHLCEEQFFFQSPMSRARELSCPPSSKMCGHLQPRAEGTGVAGCSVPFTLILFLLQMLNCLFPLIIGFPSRSSMTYFFPMQSPAPNRLLEKDLGLHLLDPSSLLQLQC